MSTTEERLARPDEGHAHLATGADVHCAGRELKAEIDALRHEIRALGNSLKVWLVVAAIIQAGINNLIFQIVWFGA